MKFKVEHATWTADLPAFLHNDVERDVWRLEFGTPERIFFGVDLCPGYYEEQSAEGLSREMYDRVKSYYRHVMTSMTSIDIPGDELPREVHS